MKMNGKIKDVTLLKISVLKFTNQVQFFRGLKHYIQMSNFKNISKLNPINFCISGLTAAGKTTHSHFLAGAFGFTYISASQILLFLNNLNPIQQRDFWLTKRASKLWNDEITLRVDQELRQLSDTGTHFIFDTFAMPWRHVGPSINIFLYSDLQSRIVKSFLSHRGESNLCISHYEKAILQKDSALLESHNRLFGISLDETWAQFDIVLDISSLISEPSFRESQRSINVVNECLYSAVMFALTGDKEDQFVYKNIKSKYSNYFIKDRLIEF